MADGALVKRQRFNTPIVTLKVGQDHIQNFFVHEATIKSHSDFFKTALDKKWREGESRIIELPDDEAEVLSEYLDWLYDGEVNLPLSDELYDDEGNLQLPDDLDDIDDKAEDLNVLLVKMYIFGEKVLDAKFCNAIIGAFVGSAEAYSQVRPSKTAAPYFSTVSMLFAGTAPGSPLRRYMVDIWVSEAHEGVSIPDDDDELHPDFARDLIKALLDQSKEGDYVSPDELPSDAWYMEE